MTSEAKKQWRRDNPDKVREYVRRYKSKPEVKARALELNRLRNPPKIKTPHVRVGKSREQLLRDWRAKNYAKCQFYRCRNTAKRKGLEFDLTIESIEALLTPMVCSVTGMALVILGDGSRHGLQPSIDQKDPGGGYTQDNIRIVSWIYNRAKGCGSDREVLEMALSLVAKSGIDPV